MPPMRAFAFFSHEGKEGRGMGAKPPISQSAETQSRQEETCCVPTRPTRGESQRIGAMRWHKRICKASAETQFLQIVGHGGEAPKKRPTFG